MRDPILVTRPLFPDREAFNKYVDEIWEGKWMTNQGPLHERLSDGLKQYLGIDHITLTVNGHMALEVALRGLRVHGEVITTPFTFASTTHAISLCGLQPVFCDIRESDLTIDADQIEALITDKTEAILPVHVYGHPCDTEKIEQIAHKHNLKVLYDAAHAFGVRKNGRCIALEGDASIFSFHATKLFNTIEGGAIVYNEDRYKKIFDMFKNFGIENEESIPFIGGNGKMNEFQAAMGLANLPLVDDVIAARKDFTLHYRERLSQIRGVRVFEPEVGTNVDYNYAYLPILLTGEATLSRDELYEKLRENSVIARKYFYPILSDCACYRNLPSSRDLPMAQMAAKTVMTLPLYADIGHDTIDYVCDVIEKYLGRK